MMTFPPSLIIDKDLFGREVLRVIYEPPENSSYSSIEMFDEIEN